MRRPARFFISLIAGALSIGNAAAVTLFQVDDFSSGTAGWSEGNPSPNAPGTEGIGNDGSPYLRNNSAGGGGPGSSMAMFNSSQWTGNFVSEGVTAIRLEAGTFGSAPIDLRLGFNGAGGWFSTIAIPVINTDPGDPEWNTLTFDISPGGLAHVANGTGTYADTMGNVTMMEIFSAAGPTLSAGSLIRGDRIAASLLVDQITAIPEPRSFLMCSLGALAILLRRKRQ